MADTEDPQSLSIAHNKDSLNLSLTDHILMGKPLDTLFEPEKPSLHFFRLLLITIMGIGVQFSWAVQIGYSTPIFRMYGLPKVWVSLAWLAGPISGMIVQPLVGILSDRLKHRFRRRMFLLIGTILIIVSLQIFANADVLGRLCGDHGTSHTGALVISIVGFWILDLSINAVQGPARTLIVDLAPDSQQSLGNALYSLMTGVGNCLGYFCGSLNIVHALPFFKTNLRALYTIACLVILVTFLITFFASQERPAPWAKPRLGCKDFFRAIKTMPKVAQRVCLVQFCCWFAWFTVFVYATAWVGRNIYHGNPDAPKTSHARKLYEEGVRMGNLGMFFQSLVALGYSAILPLLLRYIGYRPCYFFGQLVQTGALFPALWVRGKSLAVALIALLGIPWATTMCIPWALSSVACGDANERGLYMSLVNLFQCIPELCMSVVMGLILHLFHGELGYPLMIGGCFALLGAVLVVVVIRVPPALDRKPCPCFSPAGMEEEEEERARLYRGGLEQYSQYGREREPLTLRQFLQTGEGDEAISPMQHPPASKLYTSNSLNADVP